jgi:choline dehydrogenase-like flavoprotein
MTTALIIGSGPAAAGAALALAVDPTQQVTVVDLGATLEPDLDCSLGRLAATSENAWSPADVALIGRLPAHPTGGVLPEKRTYGSDFPFRNVGQLDGIIASGAANASVVSGAYGGFSQVWGAQVMPFSDATFEGWPVSSREMQPHYRMASEEMTLAGDPDDLAELFPLPESARPLPPPAGRTAQVLDRYQANRALVRSHGITLGRARLAFRAESCTRCGMCMTGCPYGLIYSSSHTFDRLRAEKRIQYRAGVLAVRLEEVDGVPRVLIRDPVTGSAEWLAADRVFVACGGIGTTRLVLGSLDRYDRAVHLQESVQFVVPMVSRSPIRDPRTTRDFTLNQFNMLYDATGEGVDLCQVHFYEYNPALLAGLPAPLRHRNAAPLIGPILRRISVGLGYVPGWAAPRVMVVAHRSKAGANGLPALEISRIGSDRWPPMLKDLVRVMLRVAPTLDLWPVVPMISMSAAAKSYHFGSSFPHDRARSATTTDRTGRLAAWENIHLVDASVFPSVPATTFTLTVMANAHRIVSEALGITQ